MKKLLFIFLSFLIVTATAANAYWQSRLQISSGVVTYSGPVDVVAAPKGIWLLRAASSADRGNRLINICNVADVACADWSSDAATGALTPTTVGVTDCTAVVTCTVKTIYDRSGASFCTGAVACDVTNATIANRPIFTWNSGNPYLTFTAASSQRLCSAVNIGANIAQPASISWVAERISGTGFQETLAQNGAQVEAGFNNSANTLLMYAGSFGNFTATDGNFYAVQSIFNGASSSYYVNGTGPTTVNAGANSYANTAPFCIGGTLGSGNLLNGLWRETGVWSGATSAGNQATLNLQQRAFWGF